MGTPYGFFKTSEYPSEISTEMFYIVSDDSLTEEMVLMRCPKKKCKERISMRLRDQAGRGFFALTHDESGVSLEPSVVCRNCHAHFWVKKSEIVFCDG